MKTLPNITSLRFVLALLVVLFHIPDFFKNRGFPYFDNLPFFHKGAEAVYMFFSLSGFLIIRQLFIEKTNTNSIDLKAFFLRRILRIFPLYYLVLGFGLLYYRIILPYLGYPFESNYDLWNGVFLSVTFFPNILSSFKPGGIINVLWSIGIEEQFYILIAPLFFLIPIKRIIPFFCIFTILYFIIFFSEFTPFLKDYRMYFFYFSFSGLCSILLIKSNLNAILHIFKLPLFFVFILYFTTSIFFDNFQETHYHLFSMILFGVVICIFVSKPIIFFENKKMQYLGKISYGIYMFHAIMMQLVGFAYLKFLINLNLPNYLLILISNILIVGLTILAAHFSYKYYESYFLNLKVNFQSKRI
jgi:peptidoglycan/LPS O-acetylase OafA/YrhL